jgi:thiol-disulfide isomerase/thioredoxin
MINTILTKLKPIKPWFFYLAIFLTLRYTGALSEISYYTNKALLTTGAMDADAEPDGETKSFNYDFKIEDLEGNTVDVNELKGKIIFLNIWATWCGPCRVEMPSIQKLYEKVDHDKIVFIMLSIDRKDPKNKVTSFLQDKNYTFPVYLPSGELTSQLEQVSSIPTTFVIEPNGKIATKEVGVANYDTEKFQRFIEGLAKK